MALWPDHERKSRVFSYVAYDLGVHSTLPLPELIAKDIAADVVVHLGKVDCSLLAAVDAQHSFWATHKEACHFFSEAGAFLVRDGREIIIDPIPEADERVVRLSLLGPALALLLHQRGQLVLHASAVAIAGRVVAFLGEQGRGKSTTAAVLHGRGHSMVADDVLAIDMRSDSPLAIPSFPQFKLWPESAGAIGESPEVMPLLHPAFTKRACCVMQGFAQTSLPLARLLILEEGPTLRIEPLPPQEALRALISHWYGRRFGRQLLQVGNVAAHFRQCTRLVNYVDVCRLTRPSCLSALPNLARFVEKELLNG
jgi:hypothetical protein